MKESTARRWGNLLAWNCPQTSSATVGGVDRRTPLLPEPVDRTQCGDPHVLAGVAFCFGDNNAYYLPLPCPLPPLPIPSSSLHVPHHSQDAHYPTGSFGIHRLPPLLPSHSTPSSSTPYGIGVRPDDPSVLICRYVGFPLILRKCPYLVKQACKPNRQYPTPLSPSSAIKSKIINTSRSQSTVTPNLQIDHKNTPVPSPSSTLFPNEESQSASLAPPRTYQEWRRQYENNLLNTNNTTGSTSKQTISETRACANGKTSQSYATRSDYSASNPLMIVSRHWAAACRIALAIEWRKVQ